MDPVTAVVVVAAVVGAVSTWMSSEKAKKASKKERDKMAALLDKVQAPNFDGSDITPEDYELVGKYTPEVAKYVAEANPTVVKADSEGAVRGRQSQMEALDRFRQLGATGDDTQSRLLRQQSLRDAQIQNQGQQESIKQNMAQRGVGGSGLELISSLLAQQGANKNASESAERAAVDSYNRRLDALRTGAALGGDIRNEDVALESKNADIINQYNQRFAEARNNYNRYAADTRNEGQRLNIAAEQDIANRNTSSRNQAAVRNQDNRNDIEAKRYDAEMAKVKARMGISSENIASDRQDAQDQNAAIGGLQTAAYQGANYYQGRSDRAEDREDRAKYGNYKYY